MIKIRKSEDRGFADRDWLQSWHTFSFASYYDSEHMGFGVLRVINEDKIQGGKGFSTHPHQDMEIITYVISGALQHKDSMGNTAIIRPGEVQRMSAGTGVQHSEFNPLQNEGTHLLQIWILPNKKGVTPSYGQKDFSSKIDLGEPVLIVSHDRKDDSIAIHQDINLWACKTLANRNIKLPLKEDRQGWLQIITGSGRTQGYILENGDAASFEAESEIIFETGANSHFLFFDLPKN